MAGTLLHITLAEKALQAAEISQPPLREIRNQINDYRLGAVLVDLPHFEGLLANGFRLLLRMDVQYGFWGDLLHVRSPTGLCLGLLDLAAGPGNSAVALGALTHLAIDSVFHDEIHRRVIAEADGTKGLNSLHKEIEDQIELHVHHHLLGHSGMGTPYAGKMLHLTPSPSWIAHARQAVQQIHGSAPETDRFRRWLRDLARFGRLCSSSKVPWIASSPRDDPALKATSIALANKGITLAAHHLEVGWAYLQREITSDELLAAIPDKNLLDAGQASPPETYGDPFLSPALDSFEAPAIDS